MAECIDREALLHDIEQSVVYTARGKITSAEMRGAHKIIERIKCAPAVDVAPVVQGRWIRPHWKNNNYCCDCSECGGEAMHRDYQWHKNGVYPICPNCGATMDGGDSDAKSV